VALEGGKPGELNAVAGLATDRRELAMVVSNFRSADRRIELTLHNLPWSGSSTSELLLLDQERNLERVRKDEHHDGAIKIVQDLPAPGVLLLYVRPSN
jgi:hypothetical protein